MDGAAQSLEAPWPAAVSPVIELNGVGRTYGADPPVLALRDVDLALPHGTSLAIVGPSGSGKSTLLNILGCLDRPSSGTYLFDGIDVGALSDDQRAALRAEGIGFVFQTFNLLAHRTVRENVMLAEVYRGQSSEGRAERALAALARVGMTHRADFLPTRLSGGEQQRVAIARALMGDPSVLLCDEPTGNLDSANTESVLALFDMLGDAGLTLVIVTHDEQVATRMRRRVHIIDGRLTEEARR
jgi:ABC-type lipoprotein export system ATPase subunit